MGISAVVLDFLQNIAIGAGAVLGLIVIIQLRVRRRSEVKINSRKTN
jgi:hypothetical protein